MEINWNTIANASSIATLVSFALFFLGRIGMVLATKHNIATDFIFRYLDEGNHSDIYDRWEIASSEGYNGPTYIKSSIGLRKITAYRITRKYANPSSVPKKIAEYNNLPANSILEVEVKIPEGTPMYKLVAIRNDFVRIEKVIEYNGTGYIKYDCPEVKFTLLSFLYYLFM